MNRMQLGTLSLAAFSALAAVACSASHEEAIDESTQEMSTSWFAAHLPLGSADERAVLALVNDKSMSHDEYVAKCLFSHAQAAAIVDYRQGDEPADPSDDETFDDVTELDRLPFTNSTFWVAAIACARTYYGGPAPSTCGTGTSTVQQSALALEFVVDGSGSMMDDKWTAEVATLNEVFTAQAAKNDPRTGFGLIGFSDSKDPNKLAALGVTPVYPSSVDVRMASVDGAHLANLQGRLLGASPYGGTPLYEAVTGAYGYLDGLSLSGPLADATKAVILFTDGLPDAWAPELVAFVAANASKAQLFAVGIGLPGTSTFDYDAAYMGSLAVAGGTRSSATCNPSEPLVEANMCHFQVTPSAKPAAQIRDELLAAVGKIRKNIAACDIGIQVLGTGTLDPTKVTVVVEDGAGVKAPIPASATNGWSLDDPAHPTKVLVRGAFCDDLRADSTKRAKVEVGCR